MVRTLLVAAAIALTAPARAQEAAAEQKPAEQKPAEEAKPAEQKPADAPKAADEPKPEEAPGPMRRRPIRGTAMKQVVCRAIEDAKGKSGQDLANAIEQAIVQFQHANYRLTALLPGDPPIACFHSNSDPSKLPRGAR
jgi:hypothetical protein